MGLARSRAGLNSHELAAAALAALLNAIYAGGNDRNPAAAIQQLKIKMGEYFYGLLAMKRLKTSADKKAREVAKRLEKGGKARKSDPLYPKNRLERRRQNSRR